MSSPAEVLDLPQRLTLSAQAASALRKGISGKLWREFLPSERRLCDLLQVSRPTIRSALRVLADEGWIEISHGRKVRLRPRPATPAPPPRRLVALVSQQSISRHPTDTYHGVSEMRAQLARQGFTTEVFVCPGRSAPTQGRRLEAYVRENNVSCCVLLSVSRAIQEWFASRSLPALVLGSCHPEVRLPSLDVDYRAVCRHAAGVFRRHGHRRIGFVVPQSGVAGDLASEAGFLEGTRAATAGNSAITPVIVRHNGTPADIGARLAGPFRSPTPPTALLVAKPTDLLPVLMHLLQRGLRVPEQVSLIARDHDPLYETVVAHYAYDAAAFARRLSRLMLQLVGPGRLPPQPQLIFPRYVARNTVRPLREAGEA